MSYMQDFIHALKGVAAPVLVILVGAVVLHMGATPHGDRAALMGLLLFLTGIAWVVYLSFFSRD